MYYEHWRAVRVCHGAIQSDQHPRNDSLHYMSFHLRHTSNIFRLLINLFPQPVDTSMQSRSWCRILLHTARSIGTGWLNCCSNSFDFMNLESITFKFLTPDSSSDHKCFSVVGSSEFFPALCISALQRWELFDAKVDLKHPVPISRMDAQLWLELLVDSNLTNPPQRMK